MKALSHYELLEQVGSGGMGVVYRARDPRLDRLLALKMLPAEARADPGRRQRFIREAKAASALNHPNIVTIYDIGETEEGLFLAMELVGGEPLSSLLAGKPLPLHKALSYAVQTADALAAAHAAGIVHRDVKPANLMITPLGQVKVLDFGIAKLVAAFDPEASTLTEQAETRTAGVMGTAAYMSPEQAQGRPVDSRTDIFSLGVVLYEMIAGRRPFQGPTRMAVLTAIVEEEPEAPSRLNRHVPLELDRIVARCLEKDPAQRFQSVADVKIALEWLARDLETGTKGGAAVPVRTRGRKRAIAAWMAAIAIVVTVLVLVARPERWPWRRKPPPASTRLTYDTGLSSDPALSPDGKLLAYSSDRGNSDGNLDLWVQHIGGGEPRRLTSHPADDTSPHFSPDGSGIVFHRAGAGVFYVPVLGGDEHLIANAGRDPQFSPDGTQVAYWVGDTTNPAASGSVYVTPFGQAAPRRIAPEFFDARFALWSPDGRRILFQGRRALTDEREWWIVPWNGGAVIDTGILSILRRRRIEPVPGPGDWQRGDVLFSGQDPDGRRHVWRIPVDAARARSTGPPEQLTSGAGVQGEPSLARDGRLAFASWEFRNTLWRLSLRTELHPGEARFAPLSESSAFDINPTLSANGRMLAFLSRRTGLDYEIWIRDLSSGAEGSLTIGPGEKTPPVIAPDGALVAYATKDGARQPIHLTALSGVRAGATRTVCDDCGAPILCTAQGRQILYLAGQPASIHLLEPESQQRSRILQDPERGIDQARLSPDGRRIAFVATAGRESRIFVAPFRDAAAIGPAEWTPITDGTTFDDKPRWHGNDTLIFYSNRDRYGCLWKQRIDPRTNQPVGTAAEVYHFHRLRHSPRTLFRSGFDIAVGPDLLILNLVESTGNIWMHAPPENR